MGRWIVWISAVLSSQLMVVGGAQAADYCPDSLNFESRVLLGTAPVKLCDLFLGHVVLVVNTASKCAYTDQYEGLETLYERYRDRGLLVAGFPSNDFGAQEPGNERQIKEFCKLTYKVAFPMFAKTHVIGANTHPFYRHLQQVTGERPRWNFHKYLLDRQGNVLGSFPSHVRPNDPALIGMIEKYL